MSEELSALIPQTDREKLKNILVDLESYAGITITNDAEFVNANAHMAELKKTYKGLEADRKAKGQPYKEKVDYINGEYNSITKAVKNGIYNFNVALGNYERQLRIKRQQEQAKRDAEAAEVRRKQEEAEQRELEKKRKYEAEGRTKLAEQAAARAEAHKERSESTVAAQVETPKLEGTHFVPDYEIEIVNKTELVYFLLSKPEYEDWVDIKTKKIEAEQKSKKGKMVFPGAKFTEKLDTRTRTT